MRSNWGGCGKLAIAATSYGIALLASRVSGASITYTDLYTLGKPAGFSSITSNGNPQTVAGGQVVGSGSGSGTGNTDHAVLWSTTAPSGIDLNPTSGFTT